MEIKLSEIAFYIDAPIEVMYKEKKHKITRSILSVNNTKCVGTMISDGMPLNEIKPLVKSVSNITEKELQYLFDQYGNMMQLADVEHLSDIMLIDCNGNLDTLPLRLCKDLAALKYDIFNWLENDLAIEL